MDMNKLKNLLNSEPDYRLDQAKQALFQTGIRSWKEASTLPTELREMLAEKLPLELPAECLESTDGSTLKAGLKLKDNLTVETVLMRHADDHNTVCVSTQVGCELGCKFCATGHMGFRRDLSAGEMLDQVLYFLRRLPAEQRVDNVVFMGMGEPFLNYEETLQAVRSFNATDKFNIGARNISISTAGLPGKIRRFAGENLQANLAISLHAADDRTRSSLMPINNKYPLAELFSAIDYYVEQTNRKVMYEYILLAGINDSDDAAVNLVELLQDRLHYLNLIPYHPTGEFTGVSPEKLHTFKEKLEEAGLNVGIRKSFGLDIKGACGQLAS